MPGMPEIRVSRSVRVVRRPGGVIELHPREPQMLAPVKDAMAVLDCSRDTVLRLIDSGHIRARKLRPGKSNSHYRVNMGDVYKLAEEADEKEEI